MEGPICEIIGRLHIGVKHIAWDDIVEGENEGAHWANLVAVRRGWPA